ncbi:MAG: 50S ribosomal protein L17 [Gemmatimonadetes bacterium]|nr:50S ribosomal protein L17 [Gemmatimonadota bacterium]
MRHGKRIAKLGRTAPHRKAMLSNMMASLFINERISTTQTRAKELKRTAERVLTCAKKGDLHARRQVLRVIADKQVVAKLFDELGPRYKSRNGGYTRVIKLGPRRGDGAFMSIVELVDRPGVAAEEAQQAETAAEEAQQAEE